MEHNEGWMLMIKKKNEFIQTKGTDILTWENYFQQPYNAPKTLNIGNYKRFYEDTIL